MFAEVGAQKVGREKSRRKILSTISRVLLSGDSCAQLNSISCASQYSEDAVLRSTVPFLFCVL